MSQYELMFLVFVSGLTAGLLIGFLLGRSSHRKDVYFED